MGRAVKPFPWDRLLGTGRAGTLPPQEHFSAVYSALAAPCLASSFTFAATAIVGAMTSSGSTSPMWRRPVAKRCAPPPISSGVFAARGEDPREHAVEIENEAGEVVLHMPFSEIFLRDP